MLSADSPVTTRMRDRRMHTFRYQKESLPNLALLDKNGTRFLNNSVAVKVALEIRESLQICGISASRDLANALKNLESYFEPKHTAAQPKAFGQPGYNEVNDLHRANQRIEN